MTSHALANPAHVAGLSMLRPRVYRFHGAALPVPIGILIRESTSAPNLGFYVEAF